MVKASDMELFAFADDAETVWAKLLEGGLTFPRPFRAGPAPDPDGRPSLCGGPIWTSLTAICPARHSC